MNTKLKFKGRLLTHILFPFLSGIVLLAFGVLMYFTDETVGVVLMSAAVIMIAVTLIMIFVNKPLVMRDLVGFAMDYAQIQKELLHDFALPYGLCDLEGTILWSNKGLREIIDNICINNFS